MTTLLFLLIIKIINYILECASEYTNIFTAQFNDFIVKQNFWVFYSLDAFIFTLVFNEIKKIENDLLVYLFNVIIVNYILPKKWKVITVMKVSQKSNLKAYPLRNILYNLSD